MTNSTDIKERLEEFRKREAEDLARLLAGKRGLTYADLSRMTIDLDALKIVPEAEARESKIAVFQKVAKKIQVAIFNPEIAKTKEALEKIAREGYSVELFLVSE